MSESGIITICVLGVLTICWGGFIHLSNRCKDLETRMTQLEKKDGAFELMQKDIVKIKDALLGTMETKGWVTHVHDLEKEVETMREICKEKHNGGH